MCGINGVFSFGDSFDSSDAINSMNQALSHRGPDAVGAHIDQNIGLGHRRLSIIDLNESANQPFSSSDGRFTLVFNGEIYNYKSLKSQLNNFDFRTESDTEVVMASFIQWGQACLQEFNGMFAFAIWDNKIEELFIARDRLGIKPLYYFENDDHFIFASEIRALLKSGLVPKKLNKDGLSDYFRYQTVHAPETIVQNVKMLMPGTCIKLSETGKEVSTFWQAGEKEIQVDFANEKQNLLNIKSLFFEAVERRMIADVPFGAFLSGGIDSSAIVGAMSEVSTSAVSTFSVVFDELDFSEEKFARIVADKFKTNHHSIELKAKDLLDDIPLALSSMDHPSGDGVNTYTVSKATKDAGITMALSGLGGDELFSGYPVFRQMQKVNELYWLQSWPIGLRSFSGKMLKAFKKDVKSLKLSDFLKMEKLDSIHAYPLSRQLFLDKDLEKLLNQNPLPNQVLKLALSRFGKNQGNHQLSLQSKISILEINSYMQNVLLRDADQMSMAHALEVRVPFLDYKLVEYMLQVPDGQKLSGFPKELFVKSLDGLLPEEVYNRPKMGFVFPWEHWLKNELRDFVENQLDFLKSINILNANTIDRLWSDFLDNSKRVNWVMIWSMVVLAFWLKENEVYE